MRQGKLHIEIAMLSERCRRFRSGDAEEFRKILQVAHQLSDMAGKDFRRDLASAAGTAPGTVSRWENGHSTPSANAQVGIVRLIGKGSLFMTEK